MQEAGGTFPRLALLGVITVGPLGVGALLACLDLRLLLAAGLGLVLLLIAPAMLIAPALGERGRATFVAFAQLRERHGVAADTVLANSTTKLFMGPIGDEATRRLVDSALLQATISIASPEPGVRSGENCSNSTRDAPCSCPATGRQASWSSRLTS